MATHATRSPSQKKRKDDIGRDGRNKERRQNRREKKLLRAQMRKESPDYPARRQARRAQHTIDHLKWPRRDQFVSESSFSNTCRCNCLDKRWIA